MTPNINKILATPAFKACSIRGADMGRRNRFGNQSSKLYVQRLRLVDGSYDTGSAYWGGPATMWCAFTEDLETMIFVRANNRAEAKALALALSNTK